MDNAGRHLDTREDLKNENSGPGNAEVNLTKKLDDCREFAKKTGYSLTVGSNVRKYGGPPPDGSERPRNAEIFLGRLPGSLFEDELVPILETYGKIWEVRVLLAEKSELGRGFAFATFYSPQVANTVVRTLTNKPIPGYPGKNFSISLSKPHSLVMIKNLPKHRTRAQLMKDFEGFFEGILGVNIWGVDGKPPVLLAALEFGSERAAAGALGQILAGEVQPYNYKMEAYYSTCDHDDNVHIVVLHVRNLPENATEDDLHNFFSPKYATFERARIVNKFAFIHFKDHQSAEKALQEQYGALFMGRPLEMAWARTKTFVPMPPPALPVSKKSEERLYAYASSSGARRAPGRAPQRSEPYPREGPPRDRRRPDPSSHGSYRGPSSQGRRESPPPYYSRPQADYRPRTYEGPPPRGNGYDGYRNDERGSSGRPLPDRGYGYNDQPPMVSRFEDPYGPPRTHYGYNLPPAQPPVPSYSFQPQPLPQQAPHSYGASQWQGAPVPAQQSPVRSYGGYGSEYGPPAVVAPPAVASYSYQQPPAPRASTASYNYEQGQAVREAYDSYQAPPRSAPVRGEPYKSERNGRGYSQSPRGKSNGARASGGGYSGSSGQSYVADQNGWDG